MDKKRWAHLMHKLAEGLSWKKIVWIVIGAAICSFGIHNIHQQTGITEGGVIGMVLLINHWLGISPAIITPILDITCYAPVSYTHLYGKLKELREEYQREIKAMEEDGGDIQLIFGFYANDEEEKSLAYPSSKERGGEGKDIQELADEGYKMYLLYFIIEKGKVVSISSMNAIDISD